MDELKTKDVDIVILKRKLANRASDMEEGDNGHSCEPKKYKNIETLDGTECYKTIRDIIKHGYREADADVVIEHKGEETVDDLIDLMFEVPTTKSEVEKFKNVISSRSSSNSTNLEDRHIVIQNVFIPSAQITNTLTSRVSNKNPDPEEEFQDLVKGLRNVDGYQTESWGSSIDAAASLFCPGENFTEEEKTLTLSQFLQDEDDVQDDESSSTEVMTVEERHYDTLESTYIRNKNHEDIVELNTFEEYSDRQQHDEQVVTPSVPAHSSAVEICTYGDTDMNSAVAVNEQNAMPSDIYAAPFHSSDDVEFCTDAFGNARMNMIDEPNEITSGYVLEMVLAHASEEPSYAKQSQHLSGNEDAETLQLSTQEHENASHNVVGVSQTEQSIQASNSNRVEGEDDDGECSSKECSTTKDKEVDNNSVVFIASRTSSMTDCSLILERVEDMLNLNKTDNHNTTRNGRQIVDTTKLQQQVKDKYDVWKKIQGAQQNNEARNSNVVPQNCLDETPSSTQTKPEVVQHNGKPQPETENDDENDDETCTQEIDLKRRRSSDLQAAASRVIDENSNSQLDSTSAVSLRNKRHEVNKIDNQQKKEQKKVNYTQKQLLAMMKLETKKETPNLSLLSEWMDKTFEGRKRMLVHPNFDLGKIVKIYPAMTFYEIVKEEYGRLLNDANKMEKLEEKLMLQFDAACKLKKNKFGKEHHLHEESKKRWKDNPNPELKKVLGMLCFSFHLAENAVVKSLCKLRREDEEPKVKQMVTPTLDVCESQIFSPKTEMWIYVDAERYLKVPNFYEGVLCIYAIYWVYNIQYPSNLKLLLEFFDAMVGNPQTKYSGDIVKLF